jgi:DNA polymerase V
MHAVSFVRTSPHALGEVADTGAICDACGHGEPVAVAEHGEGYRNPLSLDALLLRRPSSTYFVQVSGNGVTEGKDAATHVPHNEFLGVCAGDILTIDRSVVPIVGHLVLAVHDGVFVLGRFTEHEGKRYLVAENGTRNACELSDEGSIYLWGVVTAIVKRLQ